MAEKHPDLLDYLYEELPPREMVEARNHIANCPRCLEELKNLREPVKHYRDLARPAVPMGLSERTEAKALGAVPPVEALTESEHASRIETAAPVVVAAPTPASAQVAAKPVAPAQAKSQKRESAESVRREIEELKAKHSWFFHPAWTVAASVFFIFAILIHFSPRGSGWYGREDSEPSPTTSSYNDERTQSVTAPYDAIETDTVRDAEPLPALTQQKSMETPGQPPKPTSLSIAETLMREAPVTVPEKHQPMNKSAVAGQLTAIPAESPAPTASPAPLSPPVQAIMPGTEPAYASAAAPAFDTATPYSAPMAAPAYSSSSDDPQVGMPVLSAPPAKEEVTPNAFEAFVEELADQPVANQAVPDEPKDILSLDPAELEALLSRHDKEAADAGDVGIIDMTGLGQPPRLVERPEGIDKDGIVRNLIFLIGMHLGEREFDEARQGIDLLSRYEPEQANRFAAMLRDLEAVEPEAPEAVVQEKTPTQTETRTLGEMIRDITDHEESPATPEPAVEVPVDQPVEFQTGMLLPGEWREASAAPETPDAPAEDIGAFDPLPETVIIVDEPMAAVITEPLPEPAIEPAYEFVPDSEVIPLITGPTPGTQPPTLLESGPFGSQRFGRSQQAAPTAAPAYTRPYTNRRPPANRPFTTDPYYRGD